MLRNTDHIQTTHVGSLVRPQQLVDHARNASNGGGQNSAAYADLLRGSVRDVVRQQVDLGIDIVNDGEYGKSAWHTYINERLTGFAQLPSEPNGTFGKDARDFAEFYALPNMGLPPARSFVWTVTAPVTYCGQPMLQRDIANLKAAAAEAGASDVFMAAVAPASVAPGHQTRHYATDEESLFAIADALHEEYQAIVDAGLILQVDDAYLAIKYDLMVPPATLTDYRRWVELRLAALNRALEGLPRERTRYHMCWGSWNAPHVSDVELKNVVDLLLQVRVGGFALEMANPRHEHEWRLWENVALPSECILLPGVVSHATNIVEHPELVAERITRLARIVGRERVVAGTDCGFAQVAGLQRVHPSVMWAKLRALVDGARLATAELWGVGAAAPR
ncbi:MAG TPA: cobalamin-independent methionine synthase II family protein [Candidatus Binatia bacterium]|nr:cobalamin-independent methionine synthase II family protein [Candidatus Binatia bacterium]